MAEDTDKHDKDAHDTDTPGQTPAPVPEAASSFVPAAKDLTQAEAAAEKARIDTDLAVDPMRFARDAEYILATLAARKDSAIAWMNENEGRLCAGYTALATAIAARDVTKLAKTVQKLDSLAPYIAGLPYYEDQKHGLETIATAITRHWPAKGKKYKAEEAALAKLRNATNGLPDHAYHSVPAIRYLKPVRIYARPSAPPRPWKLEGSLLPNQPPMEAPAPAHASTLPLHALHTQERTTTAAIAAREKALHQLASYTHILPRALSCGDAAMLRALVTETAADGTLPAILSAAELTAASDAESKKDKDKHLNFTAAVLSTIDDPQACTEIYRALVEAGQPMAMQAVIERAVTRPGTIDPVMLEWGLERIFGDTPPVKESAEMLRWLYQSPNGKPSLIEQSASQPEIFNALTARFGHHFDQGRALCKIAARVSDKQPDTAKLLYERAQDLVGHENCLRLSRYAVVNPHAVLTAHAHDHGLDFMTADGKTWQWGGGKTPGKMAYDYIALFLSFVDMGTGRLANIDHVLGVTQDKNLLANNPVPHMVLVTEAGTLTVRTAEEQAEKFTKKILQSGGVPDQKSRSAVNILTADMVTYLRDDDDNFYWLDAAVAGEKHGLRLSRDKKSAPLYDMLAAHKDWFAVGGHLLNLSRISALWIENGQPYAAAGAHTYELDRDTATVDALRQFAADTPCLVALNDHEWVAPARIDYIRLQAHRPDGTIEDHGRILIDGPGPLRVTAYDTLAEATARFRAVLGNDTAFIMQGDNEALRISAISTLTPAKDDKVVITCGHRSYETTLTDGRLYRTRNDLLGTHGFMALGDTILHPRAVDFACYDGKMLDVLSNGKFYGKAMEGTEADIILEKFIAQTKPDKPTVLPQGASAFGGPTDGQQTTNSSTGKYSKLQNIWFNAVYGKPYKNKAMYKNDYDLKGRRGPRPGY